MQGLRSKISLNPPQHAKCQCPGPIGRDDCLKTRLPGKGACPSLLFDIKGYQVHIRP